MIVRAATPSDVDAVAAVYAHWVLHGFGTFEEVPPGREEMAARMAAVRDSGHPWLVAEADGLMLGYAYAGPYRPRSGYRFTVESSVYVTPETRRRGAGLALLEELIQRCTDNGLRQMLAAIGDSGNEASINLHHACGFRPAGVLKDVGFKQERWLDVVWMQRTLGWSPSPEEAGLLT